MRKIFGIIIALGLLGSLSLSAQTSVNALARQISQAWYEHNPAYFSALGEVESRVADNRLPDPKIELEQLWGPRDAGNKFTASVSQEFEFPTVYSKRSQAAKTQLDALTHLNTGVVLDKTLEAKLAILEYIYLNQCGSRLLAIEARLDSIESASTAALNGGGDMTVLDRNKLRIERMTLKQRIADLDVRRNEILAQISEISCGLNYKDRIDNLSDFPLEPMLSLDDYIARDADLNPEARYATGMAEAAEARMKALKAERLPGLSVGYIFNREEGVTFNGVSFGISLPLYSRASSRNALIWESRSLELDRNLAIIKSKSEISASYKNAERLRQLIAEYTPVVEDPANIDLLDLAYSTRTINMITYLQELNYFTEAELSLLQARYDYAVALARLNRYDLLIEK